MLRVKLQNVDRGKWSQITDTNRIIWIEEAVRLWCDVYCANKPVKVLIDYLGYDANDNGTTVQYGDAIPDLHGFYLDSVRTLFINRLHLHDMAQTIDTVAHEMRHSFQIDQVWEMKAGRDHHPDAAKWRINFNNPIHPKKDQMGYWNMAIERDAREYAELFAKDAVI